MVKEVAFSSFFSPFSLDRQARHEKQKVLPDPTP
jgi:hypothetical protein